MEHYDPKDYGYCSYCGRFPHLPGCPAYQPEPVCYCAICNAPIYAGETIYKVEELAYHEECFDKEYRCEA